ncbi:MptD family putative ECF transporter S component [Oscillospiraceae bacterium PP1C4]
MKKHKNSNRLNGKDLMNVGIFTALFLVIGIGIACTIGLIPIGFILLPCIQGIVLGIPMMLYFTKITKFGMVLIMVIVNGVMMVLTGMGFDSLIYGTILALIAELILKSGKYQSANSAVLAFAVVSMGACANYIHWINASAEFLKKNAASFGEAYMYTIAGYFKYWWVFPLVVLSAFVSGLFGGLLGKSVLKKHFVRSGLI